MSTDVTPLLRTSALESPSPSHFSRCSSLKRLSPFLSRISTLIKTLLGTHSGVVEGLNLEVRRSAKGFQLSERARLCRRSTFYLLHQSRTPAYSAHLVVFRSPSGTPLSPSTVPSERRAERSSSSPSCAPLLVSHRLPCHSTQFHLLLLLLAFRVSLSVLVSYCSTAFPKADEGLTHDSRYVGTGSEWRTSPRAKDEATDVSDAVVDAVKVSGKGSL